MQSASKANNRQFARNFSDVGWGSTAVLPHPVLYLRISRRASGHASPVPSSGRLISRRHLSSASSPRPTTPPALRLDRRSRSDWFTHMADKRSRIHLNGLLKHPPKKVPLLNFSLKNRHTCQISCIEPSRNAERPTGEGFDPATHGASERRRRCVMSMRHEMVRS